MKNMDEIIADFLAGKSLSEEEMHLFTAWRMQRQENEMFTRHLQEMGNRQKALEKNEPDPELPYKLIRVQIARRRRSRVLKRVSWVSVAASLTMVIGFALWVSKDNLPFMAHHNEKAVLPALHRSFAELTLEDGKMIPLYQHEERVISMDESSNIKNTPDALVYTVNEEFNEIRYNTLTVPMGAEFNLILSDGTKVYLNSGSVIRYPVAFTGKEREVFLSGEAFFEVKKDSSKQFIVNTENLVAQVLGTSFNIKSYPQQESVTATLQSGLLRVILPDITYDMRSGNQVIYHKQIGISEKREVDTEIYTSWREGYYFFNQTPLDEILSSISMWYNLDIIYQDADTKRIPFTGQLKRYDDFTHLLVLFEATGEVQFIVTDNKIVVKRK